MISPEAAETASAAGLDVVMDRCMKIEHGRYFGEMHWFGLNTGLVTARRPARGPGPASRIESHTLNTALNLILSQHDCA